MVAHLPTDETEFAEGHIQPQITVSDIQISPNNCPFTSPLQLSISFGSDMDIDCGKWVVKYQVVFLLNPPGGPTKPWNLWFLFFQKIHRRANQTMKHILFVFKNPPGVPTKPRNLCFRNDFGMIWLKNKLNHIKSNWNQIITLSN